jgi:DNA modification methylase
VTAQEVTVSYQLLTGDALTMLRTLPSESVQCCVTSPPYLGLRAYLLDDHLSKDLEIGTEESPELYAAKLTEVFREVRRVLRNDGTLWLNLGDSYNGSGGAGGDYGPGGSKEGQPKYSGRRIDGLKNKDLIGAPWLVAFALRSDGWYLRSDIIWSKKNCMPESVLDRPTRSHEYLFLFAKSSSYFYDIDAIREPYDPASLGRYKYQFGNGPAAAIAKSPAVGNGNGHSAEPNPNGRIKRSVWTTATAGYPGSHYATYPPELVEPCVLAGSRPGDTVLDPFFGSGTTIAVALKHGRRAIGIDLDERNVALAHQRIAETQPMLLDVTA